jgi:hypothetical protein
MKKNGGSIFPLKDILLPQPGISLRDVFALVVTWKLLSITDLDHLDASAQRAYAMADAMIEARDRP